MDAVPTTRRAIVMEPIREAEFPRGINLEDLPMIAGTKTESVTSIAEFLAFQNPNKVVGNIPYICHWANPRI